MFVDVIVYGRELLSRRELFMRYLSNVDECEVRIILQIYEVPYVGNGVGQIHRYSFP